MNIPTELASKVVDNFKATPMLFGLLIINVAALIGFAFTLNEVSNAMERREAIIMKCLEK